MHALVFADGTIEYNAFVRVLRCLVDEPIPVTDAFGGDQRAFGIQAVENIFESRALGANQVLSRNFQVVEKQLVGFVIDHVRDRSERQAPAHRLAQIDDENGDALGFAFYLCDRRGARQQEH